MIAYVLVKVLPKWLPAHVQGVNVAGGILTALLALGYSAKTLARVPAWESPISLNTSAIKVSPNSARANLFMGTALFNEAKVMPMDNPVRKENMYKAQWFVQKAVRIVPTYYSAIHMLSGLDAEIYSYDKNLDTLLAKFQSYMPYRENLNIENVKTGAVFMDLYLEYLNSPMNAASMVPFYKNIIPIFSEQKKDYKNALRYLQMALQIAPQDPWFNEQMGKVQAALSTQGAKQAPANGGALPLTKPGN
jgi:tetratricopeptide (TPR) repeat protein